MYQSSSHRKHKVIPLNRANAELEEDIRGFISIVEKKIGLTGKLIEKCNDNYERAEQEFPRMISEITEFYDRLYEVLTKK